MRLVLIFFGLLAGNCAMNITGSAFPRETNVGCLIERTLLDALVFCLESFGIRDDCPRPGVPAFLQTNTLFLASFVLSILGYCGVLLCSLLVFARLGRPRPGNLCANCGYPKYGLTSNRCPECGEPIC